MTAARMAAALLLALGLVGMSEAGARADPAAGWSEAKWPFLIDEWGLGRAFHCTAPACGSGVWLYLRAKSGSCDCARGVADDEDLDRVGDVRLAGAAFRAQGAGEPVTVAWMKGRSRGYAVEVRPPRFAFTVAIANKCDAIVATVVAEHALSSDIEQATVAFLSSDPMLHWARTTTGLQ